ncbi:NAD(P)/FAD-dependent oxidoreductase [Winogradskyella aurantiaca]|uniref:NAD(P)/FAD-dependent oxidoreductase n=1 Tax=Winogradskyella aurantiaca TaxID=2219558 RepID=UPI000E1D60FE|nr:FAD-dependent oxidoreductase [Winogradskyella aurantiaca]
MGKNVGIIGGGIIGLCCAYYLEKEGHQVTVIDKCNFNKGASYVNAGYITPSHIIPLSAPGVISKGLKWMLNPVSPFYMKPRLDLDFLKWTWKFKSFATKTHVERSIKPLLDINILSRELYQDLKTSGDFDFHYQHDGLLMAYKTDKMGEEEWKVGRRAIEEGLEVSLLSPKDLRQIEPNAQLNVKGAVYFKSDAQMTPTEFMPQLLNHLQLKGVSIKAEETVQDITTQANKVRSITTEKGQYKFDEVVLASGAWTQKLAHQLGLKIWLQAGKGYSINVNRPTGISLPTIFCEAKAAVSPMNGFTRFAGTMEIGGINHDISKVRVKAIAKAAESYYHNLSITDAEIEAANCGLRPVSPDGLPYIGRVPSLNNITIATGHAMMGWSMGPATGKLVTEIISDQPNSIAINAFLPDRKM